MQVIRSIRESNSRYKGEKVEEYRREKDVLEIKMNVYVLKYRSAVSLGLENIPGNYRTRFRESERGTFLFLF